ncbi:hypothetical protein ACFLZR_02050 [Candidatus Neomarinimicrobiota bacterium]
MHELFSPRTTGFDHRLEGARGTLRFVADQSNMDRSISLFLA